ncbi:MAG TPA: hypothetical protein VFD92_28035 [Candidatus Binatia bacterium]|nr:hypothetical protein [Candidatus Binatia bacterium]
MNEVPEALAELLEDGSRHEAAALDRLISAAWEMALAAETRAAAGDAGADDAVACLADAARVAGDRDALARLGRRLASEGPFAADLQESSARASALLAAGEGLASEPLVAAARGAADAVVAAQRDDGLWSGARPSARALGLLARAGAPRDGAADPRVAAAWRRGVVALRDRQCDDGTWSDGASVPETAGDAAVTTALVVLEALAPALARAPELRSRAAVARATTALACLQDASGGFSGGSVADAIACTLAGLAGGWLVAAIDAAALGRDGGALRFVERGFAWVLAAMGESGWGERPGAPATARRTAEAVVLLAAMKARRAGDLSALARVLGWPP